MEDETEELDLSLNKSQQECFQISDANSSENLDEPSSKSKQKNQTSKQVLNSDQHFLHDVAEWRERKEAKEKLEAIEKIKQFKVRISVLEKERNSQIFNKKHEFRKEFCEIEELEMKMANDRMNERESLKSQLRKISTIVIKFRKEIESPKDTPAFVDKLKVLMEEIESSMVKYKQQQGAIYEEMMKLEKQFTLDINSSQKKIEAWSTITPAVVTSQKTKQDENRGLSAPPEVKAFEKFLLQTGGHQGGWDEYDHAVFLKLKKQIKNSEDFQIAAESQIPTHSRSEILEHAEWYTEYLLLRERKRTAIAKWKDMKQSERQELLQKIEADGSEDKKRNLKKQHLLEQEKLDRFSKLERWKLEKEMRTREEVEREKRKLEQERLKKLAEEEARREEAKLKVENYQKRKQEKERILLLAQKTREEQEKLAKQVTNEEKERIKERDKRMLEERARRLQVKETEKKEKEKRLNRLKSQVEVRADRNPSRLYQLTEGWKERKKTSKTENSAGPLLSFQHRAVPSWRKGT